MFIVGSYARAMRLIRTALIAVALATLTGCSGSADINETARNSPPVLTDGTVFLEQVKTTWDGPIPDDEILISQGSAACSQLQAGVPHPSVTILDVAGDSHGAITNTRSVVDAAALSLCPAAAR